MSANPLTDTKIRKATYGEKNRLPDGGGLYLELSPAGGKHWRLKYRFAGKEKRLSLGAYPEVGLGEARERREAAKKLLAGGIDPGEVRREQKIQARTEAVETFGALAEEFLAVKCSSLAEATRKKKREIFNNNLKPWLETRPIRAITAPELLAVIRRVESRGANELAHRTLNLAGQIMRYAVASGRAERDPAADLRDSLSPVVADHHAALTDPKQVGGLLRAIDGFDGTFVVGCALRMAPLVFVRPGELRAARWADIDLEISEWRYHVSKTKTDHVVPLSVQALAILNELQPLTGGGEYVFPSVRRGGRPMSENTINAALRRCGFDQSEMSAHGFRALARTILDEVLGERVDLIEQQLAHQVKDANGRAYNRTRHLPERRRMMQRWADYLDELRTGAKVIPFVAA